MGRITEVGTLLNSQYRPEALDIINKAIAKAGSFAGAARELGVSLRSMMRWASVHKLKCEATSKFARKASPKLSTRKRATKLITKKVARKVKAKLRTKKVVRKAK